MTQTETEAQQEEARKNHAWYLSTSLEEIADEFFMDNHNKALRGIVQIAYTIGKSDEAATDKGTMMAALYHVADHFIRLQGIESCYNDILLEASEAIAEPYADEFNKMRVTAAERARQAQATAQPT